MSIVHKLHIPYAFSVPGELWLAPAVAMSLAVAALAGLVPPRRAAGPDRIPPNRPASPLLSVVFGAMGVYLFSVSAYATLKHPPGANVASNHVMEVPAADMAYLSTVPPLLGFLALLFGGHISQAVSGQDLGLTLRRLPRGMAMGLIGFIIVVPPLFVLMQLLDLIYRAFHYQHPTEHPLLHTLGQKPGATATVSILIGTCVIAPVAEELFFRGYLQTLIRHLFYRLSTRRAEPTGFPVISPATDTGREPAVQREPLSKGAQTWMAIVVTSALFASVHPGWTWPIIFALALCLGYAYERTGNLWVSITIHAGFNIFSTALFLMGLYAPH